MRIEKDDVSRVVYFVAVDAIDLKTRETSLSNEAVYYSIDGGSATAMTSPTITAVDATNMPGVFKLAIDEAGMVILGSGVDEAALALHITADEMVAVSMVVEIYRTDVALVVGATPISRANIETDSQTGAVAAFAAYDPPTKAELDIAESNIRGLDSDDLKDISDQIDDIPTVEENRNAIFGTSGITAGGTWSFAKILKVLAAWATGKWQDKSGSPGTYEVLDAEDGTTKILEVTPSETSPQKDTTVS